MFTSSTDGCYQLCKSGVSLKHSYANVPCETPVYKAAAEEELELIFREEEVFEGSIPARRKNWMKISIQLILSRTFSFTVRKKGELCS